MKSLLSVTELANRLNVSRRTVWRMKDSGELPTAVTIRGCLRWRPEVIEAWLADGAPHCRRTNWSAEAASTHRRHAS